MNKPIFCYGDSHGCGYEVEALIKPFVDTHTIYSVSDSFDRGFHGTLIWDLIHKHSIQCVQSNHEIKMLDYLEGRRDHLPSHYYYYYFLNQFSHTYDLQNLVDFLKNLPLTIKLDDRHLLAHGGVCLDNPWREDVFANVYGRYNNSKEEWQSRYKDDVVVVYGHQSFNKVHFGYSRRGHINSIGIDTAAAHGNKLTGVEIINGEYKFHEVPSKNYFQTMKSFNPRPNQIVLNFRENEIRKNTD